MDNRAYLIEVFPDISQGIITAVMQAREVVPEDQYKGGREVELAEADLNMRLLNMPEYSEGSLSVKYNPRSLKEEANRIYKKYGDARYDSGQPLIKRMSL